MDIFFNGPKSYCKCGHLGDGDNSDHIISTDRFGRVTAQGHGPCKVAGCSCSKFAWDKFTEPFMNWYNRNAEMMDARR